MPPPDGTTVAPHPKTFAPSAEPEFPPLARLQPAVSDYIPAGFERVKSHVVPVPIVQSQSLLRTFGINAEATKTLIAGVAYCTASVSMVLLNKTALSQYPLQSPTMLLAVQCMLCVLLVMVLQTCNVVHTQRITWPIVRLWIFCNVVFVMMLFSRYARVWLEDSHRVPLHTFSTTTVLWPSSFSVSPC